MKYQHFGSRTVIRVLIKGLYDCPAFPRERIARPHRRVVQVARVGLNSSAARSFSRFIVNYLAAFIAQVNASYEIHITVSRGLKPFSPLASTVVAVIFFRRLSPYDDHSLVRGGDRTCGTFPLGRSYGKCMGSGLSLFSPMLLPLAPLARDLAAAAGEAAGEWKTTL